MSLKARDYQSDAGEAVFYEFDRGIKRTMLHMATGLGKTVTGGFISIRWLKENPGGHILFMADREEILRQTHRTINKSGLRGVMEMAQERARGQGAQVVLGSVQTLRGDRLASWPKDYFGLIIADECHHIYTARQLAILNHFEGAKLVGLTATAGRSDGKRLSDIFQSIAYSYGITKATKDGWLCPLREFVVPINVDLRGISTTGGEYNAGDLAERIGPKVERIARAIAAEIGERQTIVFAPDVGSAVAISHVLNQLGVPSQWVAGSGGVHGMPKKERRAVILGYECFEYQVICCCDLLGEGWDNAATQAVVNARPTRSPFAYAQRVGRGTRTCPEIGKTDCLVLDLDWQAEEEHRTYTTVDLYADDLDVPLPTVARNRVKDRIKKETVDILEAIKEADNWVRTRPNLGITLTGAMPEYELIARDGAGIAKILGLKWQKGSDERHLTGREPEHLRAKLQSTLATVPQQRLLRTLGVDNPEHLTKWGAAKLITELKARSNLRGSPLPTKGTLSQVQEMIVLGIDPDLARTLSHSEASQALANLEQASLAQFQDDAPF